MKNYLVTGGAGFIGSAVARRLLEEGNNVTVIDNLRTGDESNIPQGVHFLKGGVEDGATYQRLGTAAFDAIYHIAGQSSGEISFDDPVYDLQTNTQSTLFLLQHARKTGCRKLIYASSMSIYGDQPEGAVSESGVPVPKSFYAVGKLASEHYLRIYSQFGIATTALRLYNTYGPGQNMTNLRQGMLSIYLAQALASRTVVVKGSADRFRDFVYIDDVVEAFLAAGRRAEPGYLVFNICTGAKTTVASLLDQMTANLPFPVQVEFASSTPGDQFGIVGDNSSAGTQMNWAPKTSLQEGMGRMVSWALAVASGK